MVHLELGGSNSVLLDIAARLSEQFQARVIGIAACQPMQVVYGEGCYVPSDIIQDDRLEIDKQIKDTESEFRSALKLCAGGIEWRSAVTYGIISDYLAHEARSADLVLTGAGSKAPFSSSRRVNKGDLVMQAGRPVLIVPAGIDHVSYEQAVIGWKDTRESRRAIHDALPLLKRMAHVHVVAVTSEEHLGEARGQIEDVVAWMKCHGITARASALPSTGDDVAYLKAIAENYNADIIIAGAYGHSRLREWALGGVTRDLLLHADRCALVSH
jgi:nucleotide-binding universal stress UspA family protein